MVDRISDSTVINAIKINSVFLFIYFSLFSFSNFIGDVKIIAKSEPVGLTHMFHLLTKRVFDNLSPLKNPLSGMFKNLGWLRCVTDGAIAKGPVISL